jgi:hypothetical protein
MNNFGNTSHWERDVPLTGAAQKRRVKLLQLPRKKVIIKEGKGCLLLEFKEGL